MGRQSVSGIGFLAALATSGLAALAGGCESGPTPAVSPVASPVATASAVATGTTGASANRSPASSPGAPASVAERAPERPWSVQLHVHGSYSEGVGSIDSHSWEATDVGADAIWWSDHDFRVDSYRHPATFGFEDWTEPLDRNEPWKEIDWLPRGRADDREEDAGPAKKGLRREPLRSLAGGDGAIVADRADEGTHSFRVRAIGSGPDFGAHLYPLKASRAMFKRPLGSDVSVAISVFPEKIGPDAHGVVEIGLSEHAPRGDLPMVGHAIRYVLVDASSPARRSGAVAEIGVAVEPGRWNRIVLPVARDASESFPGVTPGDDSMVSIAIGVESRGGAEASVLFDRFRIEQRLSGAAAWKRQAEVIGDVARDYPRLAELQGSEISYASHHLNEFSLDAGPIDYDDVLARVAERRARDPKLDPGDEVARIVVDGVHAKGGLVSYNHMYGAPMAGRGRLVERDETLEEMVDNRLYGADILEVGYRDRGGHDLADHVGAWDDLAAHGIFPVGVGVSDSHGGNRQRWRTSPNNFVTWILAPAPTKPDLLEGLRAGRAFFGDVTLFDGSLDMVSDRGFRMGQVVVTDRPQAEISVDVQGLEKGDVLRVVDGGAGASLAVDAPAFSTKRRIPLRPDRATVFRVEADSSKGTAKVLGNPIVFVRSAPEGGVPPARGGFDVGGLVATRTPGFRVDGVAAAEGGVVLRGRAEGARLELDAREFGAPASVEAEGEISGTWEWRPPTIVLDGLSGDGRIFVRRASAAAPAAPAGERRPLAHATATPRSPLAKAPRPGGAP
ncbi:MAG: hypothetical protein ACKOCT_07205 [Alphaproteobacteria bacterium]